MWKDKLKISETTDGKPPRPGFEEAGAPAPIESSTGQHLAYWVLSADERAKGFVRPVRDSYLHVGAPAPKYPLRDLNADEEYHRQFGYFKFEEYPESEKRGLGRFWTQAQLDAVGKGCGSLTTMGRALAETYARDPHYYGSTFCCACRKHLPVGEQGEFIWDDGSNQRVGT